MCRENKSEINGNDNLVLQGITHSQINILSGKKEIIPQNITSTPVNIVPDEYIDRNEINIIKNHFKEGHKTLMLVNGEGGIGKTTLAAKYLQTNLNNYKHFAWLLCESGIDEQILSLRHDLKIDLTGIPENKHKNIIITELNKLQKPCLLILDNANNAVEIRKFAEYYNSLEWDILITSRCNNVVEEKNELRIEYLPPEKAKKLFKYYYDEKSDNFENQLDFLLQSIGYNTLILQLFAKYLKEWNKNIKGSYSIKELNEEFRSDGIFSADENIKIPHQHNKIKVNEIISKLYNLSVLNSAEEQLLFNFSLLPLEPIPYTHLVQILVPNDIIEFDNTLDALNEKGWLTRNKGKEESTYKINQVIQQFMIYKNKIDFWVKSLSVIEGISKLLETNEKKDNPIDSFIWVKYGDFLLSILPYKEEYEDINNLVQISRLKNNLGVIYINMGEYNKAINLFEQLLFFCTNNLSENNPNISKCRNNLAFAYREIGNYEKARELLEESLKTDEINLGECHSQTVMTQNNLALVYKLLGKTSEAKDLLEKALTIDLGKYEEDHPLISLKQSNLALIYQDLGDYEKAKIIMQDALKSDLKKHGENHPSVATRKNNLALILAGLGEFEEALKLINDSLQFTLNNYSENHSYVALRYGNLAQIYHLSGDYDNALYYYDKSLKSLIKNLGENHPYCKNCMINLTMVYNDIGENEKADRMIEKVLLIEKNISEVNHQSLIKHITDIVKVYILKYQLNEAKDFMNRVKVIFKSNYGENHTNIFFINKIIEMIDELYTI